MELYRDDVAGGYVEHDLQDEPAYICGAVVGFLYQIGTIVEDEDEIEIDDERMSEQVKERPAEMLLELVSRANAELDYYGRMALFEMTSRIGAYPTKFSEPEQATFDVGFHEQQSADGATNAV